LNTDERPQGPKQIPDEPIARLNYGAADAEEQDESARTTWGLKAIALGVIAVLVMVIALILIIQGVYEVRPQ
jgi:hypothetical protein